jgi:hypothetical protein
MGYYVACSDNSLPTFRDNLSVPFLMVKKYGPICCPETSIRDYRYSLCNSPEERSSLLLRGGSLKSRMCRLIFGTLSLLLFLATYFLTLEETILTNKYDAFIKIWIATGFVPLAAFVCVINLSE